MSTMYDKAKELALKWHGDQKRDDGSPYVSHLIRVANKFDSDAMRSIAVLHDILEDTDVPIKELLSAGISQEVISKVVLLTRSGESYLDYVLRIKEDNRARDVKLADLADNLNGHPSGSRKDKYLLAKYLLELED